MKCKLIVVCSVLVLLAGLFSLGTAKTPTPTAEELIEAAHKASGLETATPYTFSADLTFAGDGRKGTLLIYREGDKERVELKLGDYLEKQVVLGTKHYVEALHAVLDAGNFVNLDHSWDPKPPMPGVSIPQHTFGKVSSKRINGEHAWCFDEHTKNLKITFCFDAQRAVMLERRRDKNHSEFLDYSRFGELLFPQTIKITQQWLPEITVNNIRLTRGPLAAELWVPSADSVMEEQCEGLKPPKAEYTPDPSFPPKAHQEHKTGEIVLYAIVSDQGKVVLAQSLNDDPYGFTEQAKEVVKTWRFTPGTCGGKPVNVQMILEIDFNRF